MVSSGPNAGAARIRMNRRDMMKTKHMGWAGALAAGAVMAVAAPTFAHKAFLDKARKMYELDAKNGKCDLCHEIKAKEEPNAKNLNKYGKAVADDPDMKDLKGRKPAKKDDDCKFTDAEIKTLEKVLKKIESADSDGDGATNKEELALGSNPGDAKSMPDKKALAKYRKDNGGAPAAPTKK